MAVAKLRDGFGIAWGYNSSVLVLLQYPNAILETSTERYCERLTLEFKGAFYKI
ncbi:MAG: hypothetical protein RL497_846 [Pseudomonadota bacterium]|jgi:hypothetical protein